MGVVISVNDFAFINSHSTYSLSHRPIKALETFCPLGAHLFFFFWVVLEKKVTKPSGLFKKVQLWLERILTGISKSNLTLQHFSYSRFTSNYIFSCESPTFLLQETDGTGLPEARHSKDTVWPFFTSTFPPEVTWWIRGGTAKRKLKHASKLL